VGEMIAIGVMVGIIILASAVHKYVDQKNKASIPSDAEDRILTRLNELDRRIGDIQAVMLALDEKISGGSRNG
jgi:hypothetical protein